MKCKNTRIRIHATRSLSDNFFLFAQSTIIKIQNTVRKIRRPNIKSIKNNIAATIGPLKFICIVWNNINTKVESRLIILLQHKAYIFSIHNRIL